MRLPVSVAAIVVLGLLVGCVTTPGAPEARPVPAGSPAVEAVLGDLAANDAKLENFVARIEFLLQSPEVTGKNSGRGTLTYERPAHLFARAVHHPTGVPVLELTVSGSEYLLWLPQDDKAYHSVEGLQFESVPFRVSPEDIVREMFHAEDWGSLSPREVQVEAHDDATHVTTLLIGPPASPRRRIEVVGAPFVLTRNELLDDDGDVRALTVYLDYRVHEDSGIRYPGVIEAHFPSEDTMLRFKIHRITPNTTLESGIFDIQEKLRDNPKIERYLIRE